MGNRVIFKVIDNGFRTGGEVPGVYLHWGGSGAIEHLTEALKHMRRGVADYSTARLCGYLHEHVVKNTNLSLGICMVDDESAGDAGIVEYNCSTGDVKCYDGYLADEHPDVFNIGLPVKDYY
jgi:hypothetical protein